MHRQARDVSLAKLRRLARQEKKNHARRRKAFGSYAEKWGVPLDQQPFLEPLLWGLLKFYRGNHDIRKTMRLLFRTDIYRRLEETFLVIHEAYDDGQLPFLEDAFLHAGTPERQLELFRFLLLELAAEEADADIRKDIILVALKIFAAIEFPAQSIARDLQLPLYRRLFELQPLAIARILEHRDVFKMLRFYINLADHADESC